MDLKDLMIKTRAKTKWYMVNLNRFDFTEIESDWKWLEFSKIKTSLCLNKYISFCFGSSFHHHKLFMITVFSISRVFEYSISLSISIWIFHIPFNQYLNIPYPFQLVFEYSISLSITQVFKDVPFLIAEYFEKFDIA